MAGKDEGNDAASVSEGKLRVETGELSREEVRPS
jgi:hypothetical protein